jgi:formylglycine-generating enzyme required for sulfatase activity
MYNNFHLLSSKSLSKGITARNCYSLTKRFIDTHFRLVESFVKGGRIMKKLIYLTTFLSTISFLMFNSCGKDSTGPKTNTLTFGIYGNINESLEGLIGVSVRLTGAGKDTTAMTTSTGSYVFTALPKGSFTLTPTKTDYIFIPPSITETVSGGADIIAQNILAIKSSQIPALVSIPGGTFQMGQTDVAGPIHSVTVSSFQMSETEITNAQYCTYLNAALVSGDIMATSSSVKAVKGSYNGQEYIYLSLNADANNKCWITYSNNNSFSVVSGYENWPVVFVTWYGSKAFAEYFGWDLPREAEWEYACRGGNQYEYGTDDGTISKDKANYDWGSGSTGHPMDVKSFPKNPFGLFDMSGNVWEWCNDWFGDYSSSPATNPTGAKTGTSRVFRGGGWNYDNLYCRSAGYRYNLSQNSGVGYLGFRVVRR